MGQRIVRRGVKQLLIFTAALAASGSAFAEQLTMPFACDARGGEVRLTPSEQRTYQIVGRREQHVFTVCSPTDPNRCRNWRIHRFDVDCGGERVSWLRIADAARRFARAEAFVEGGAMHLRIKPLWSAGRDDPYLDRRWARRAERFNGSAPYGDGYNEPERVVIDLPPGYAPTFGLPVSFEGGTGPSTSFDGVEGPPPAPEPYGAEADRWPDEDAYTPGGQRRYAQGSSDDYYARSSGDSPYAPREAAPINESDPIDLPLKKPPPKIQSPADEGVRAPEKRDVNTEAASPQKTGSTAAASTSKSVQPEKTATKSEAPKAEATKPEAPKPVAPKAEAAPAAAAAPKPAPPTPPGVVTPTILNAPGAAEAARAAEAAPKPAEAIPAAPPPAPEKSSPPAPQAAEQQVASPDAPAKTKTAIPVIGLPTDSGQESFAFAPWHWMAFSAGAALLTGLAWFLLVRRNAGYDAGVPPRDFAAVSLDGPSAGGTSLVAFSETARPALVPDAPLPTPSPGLSETEIRMPATLSDALQVLGASADAGPSVLKKIVEGLRQSWHPDLARSDEDRGYREQRMAQINVAWDIIEASLRPAA